MEEGNERGREKRKGESPEREKKRSKQVSETTAEQPALSTREQLELAIATNNPTEVAKLLKKVEIEGALFQLAIGKPEILSLLITTNDSTHQNFIFNVARYNGQGLPTLLTALKEKYGLSEEIIRLSCVLALDLAIGQGYLDIANLLLQLDKSLLQAQDKDGDTPLHAACRAINPEGVQFLLELGADPNAVAADGNTPLHLAIGSEDICRLLLEHKARTDIRNMDGDMVLHRAIRLTGSVGSLIEHVDINQPDSANKPPIILAIETKYEPAVISLLSAQGLDLTVTNNLGENLLFCAARSGSIDIFKMILNTNRFDLAGTNPNGSTVLHLALMANQQDMFDFLAKTKPELLSITDPVHKHPICYVQSVEMLRKFILLTDKDLLKAKDIFNLTALDWISLSIKEEDLVSYLTTELSISTLGKPKLIMESIIQQFMEQHPQSFCLSPVGESLLDKLLPTIYFTNPNHIKTLAPIIIEGLNRLIQDNPFMQVFLQQNLRLINNDYLPVNSLTLLNLTDFDDFYSGIKLSPSEEEAEKLIFAINDLNIRNASLQSLLHKAVMESNVPLVNMFLKLGMDVNPIDKYGKTPLDYCGDLDIATKLTETGAKTAKECENDTIRKQHLTIFSMGGGTLHGFPVNVGEKEASGLYSSRLNVYIAAEGKDLISTMMHEWAHRFVKLFNVDLETSLLEFFNQVDPSNLTTDNATEIDCKNTLMGLKGYGEHHQLEEFFVRIVEVITKHGKLGADYLTKNYGQDLLVRLSEILDLRYLNQEVRIVGTDNKALQIAVESHQPVREDIPTVAVTQYKHITFFSHAEKPHTQSDSLDKDLQDDVSPGPTPSGSGSNGT